ncbi:expressed unknown protein [Seminavis robusta]|uniref:Uncharacterized protein n=1 Tax=Seminavis robusta TaxID=568900 RepID=A0A9N8DVI3_9STRA|nr:expressed unknown protein [Seminavis robusta]|eukprot:Sro403_g135770.1 n/a (330) ;mRNA; r:61156-62145
MRLSFLAEAMLVGSFLWRAQAFVPRGHTNKGIIASNGILRTRTLSGSSSRLYNQIILILEEDDDNENNDQQKNPEDVASSSSRSDQQHQAVGEIQFIVDGPIPLGGGRSSAISGFVQELQEKQNSAAPRPLTAMKRARLEKEIALLQELGQGDAAATELSNLWVQERGPDTARALQMIEMLMLQGALRQAELLLVSLIKGHDDLSFVAPIHLLGSLCFMQGRFQESKDLYEIVLSQKPWHLGALAGIFNACKKLDDYQGLTQWDREQMPLMQENQELRKQWANRMVIKAQAKLEQAEASLQGFFHSGLNQLGSEGSVILDSDDDSDAWQ